MEENYGISKFYKKRKHYELDNDSLEEKMSTLTITKKLKTGHNSFALLNYQMPQFYDDKLEKKTVENFYKKKNNLLFKQMFGH
jgi:hypothetical protein